MTRLLTTLMFALTLSACTPVPADDEAELRQLFDRFAVLADQKDVASQLTLFTPDAVMVSRSDGEVTTLEGREAIGAAFEGFLSQFETVFHQNGQHLVEVVGDNATGTGYSIVVLSHSEARLTMGVIYSDVYVRNGGTWRIARRESDFRWQNMEPRQMP